MANIAINGFGRIGRQVFKAGFDNKDFNVVAINDLTDAKTLAYLLKYDSNYGIWDHEVDHGEGFLMVNGKKIPVLAEKDPKKLPWNDHEIDIVIESTGFFRTEEDASAHLEAGARRVVISAPHKGGDIPTYVLGTNTEDVKGEERPIISNASCTTNCASPMMAVLDEAFGVEKAMLTTVHGYTADQRLVDAPHKDLRRGRAAAENIVPTSTGAAIATTKTLPQLENKFDGIAIRVPTPVVSLTDVTVLLKKDVTVEEINEAYKAAAETPRFKGILAVTDEPLVSTDFIGSPHSATVDLEMTRVVDGNLVKVVAWYDNEWGYANRLAELTAFFAKQY